LICLTTSPDFFFDDITARPKQIDGLKDLDFYQYTAPCQGLSSLGQQDPNDPRNLLVTYSVLFVRNHKPKAFISEQVANFNAATGKFKRLHDWVLAEHRKDGYHLTERVVVTKDYGVSQKRARYYLVGIRLDVKRAREMNISIFPPVVPNWSNAPLKSLVSTLPSSDWMPHPPLGNTTAYENTMKAYKSCKVNPFTTPVVVDCGSSSKFMDYNVGAAPTLTATRCAQKDGYWCSTKGGFLQVEELASLQGYGDFLGNKIPWKEAGLSRHAFGHIVGNAQSGNFLLLLYPRVLFHAQLISLQEYITIQGRVNAKFSSLGSMEMTDRLLQDHGIASSSSSSGVRVPAPSSSSSGVRVNALVWAAD
jgi:hypothetical protein